MENDIKMEVNEEQASVKNSKLPLPLPILGAIAGGILLVLIVVLAVFNSPKVLMGRLINNTDDAVIDFLDVDEGETPLFMTEPHQSETELKMDGTDFGLDGDIVVKLLSGYQNSTGDLAGELELGIGDMDAITAGLYLKESELALVSSILADKYVLDLDQETELGKNTTLEDRLLADTQMDEEAAELQKRLEKKLEEYETYAMKMVPKKAMDKGKDSIEIMGKDQKFAYVEIAMDEDQFKDWLEAILEKAEDDKELEELIEDVADYLADEYDIEDIDDIDFEEAIEDALDELDDLEVEASLRIYHKGKTPVAYELVYDDSYVKPEIFAMMYKSGSKREMLAEIDVDGDKMYFDMQEDGDKYALVEYEFEDIKVEAIVEKVKNGEYEISGELKSDYGLEGDISGEIIESKNETTFEIKYDLTDGYDDYEIDVEGSVVTDGSVETTEFSVDVAVAGEDMAKVEIEWAKEEIKKNKEYAVEGEIKVTDSSSDTEYVVDIESSIVYGSDVEVDLPKWSKDDVYAKVTDEDELMELFEALMTDAETGFGEAFAQILYGDMY